MRLVRDTKDPSKLDGTNHLKQMLIAGVIAALLLPLQYQVWGGAIVAAIYLGIEVYQEYNMRDRRKAYPFNPFKWSQNRHQDWVFAVVGYYLPILIKFILVGGLKWAYPH